MASASSSADHAPADVEEHLEDAHNAEAQPPPKQLKRRLSPRSSRCTQAGRIMAQSSHDSTRARKQEKRADKSAREERRDGQAGRPASRDIDRNSRRFTAEQHWQGLPTRKPECRLDRQGADIGRPWREFSGAGCGGKGGKVRSGKRWLTAEQSLLAHLVFWRSFGSCLIRL